MWAKRPLWRCEACGRSFATATSRTRHEHPLFRRITTYSPRNHVHEFRLTSPRDAGGALLPFLRKAYAVGGQKHLERPLRPGAG